MLATQGPLLGKICEVFRCFCGFLSGSYGCVHILHRSSCF